MSNYNIGKIALYLGVSIVVFLFSSGLVGYGIVNYSYLVPDVVDGISHRVFNSIALLLWLIGTFGVIAGITGIAYTIKGLFKREIHLLVR